MRAIERSTWDYCSVRTRLWCLNCCLVYSVKSCPALYRPGLTVCVYTETDSEKETYPEKHSLKSKLTLESKVKTILPYNIYCKTFVLGIYWDTRTPSVALIWDFRFIPLVLSFLEWIRWFKTFTLFQKWWGIYICKLWMRVWKERTGRDCLIVRIQDSLQAPVHPSTLCHRGSSSHAPAAAQPQMSCKDTAERRPGKANWYAII